MRRLLIAGTVAASAAAVLLFGGAFRGEAEAPAAMPVTADAAAERLASGFAAGNTDALVRSLEARVRAGDAEVLATLGLAYQQRARETADASYLTKAEAALRGAPRGAAATEGLAALALSRHDFRGALELARRARSLSPESARPLALTGDALVELGRYREAFATFDRLALLKPGLGAYARVAYGRELVGDRAGAIEAMRLAVGAAGAGEPAAWAHVELGKLFFGQGDLPAARTEFRAALAAFPRYVFALEWLAHVEWASGRRDQALELLRDAAESVPLPQLVIALGDMYRASGRLADARDQYRLVDAIRRLLTTNGVRTDIELALFDADRGVPAVAQARAARTARPSIQADDVLGWALVREGRCVEGLRYAKRALRLGTRDAQLFFHRAMAERCLDRDTVARRWFRAAVGLNPHFSVRWSPVAARYAR